MKIELRLRHPPSTDVLNLNYGFTNSAGANNGNVVTFNSTATQIFMRTYTYDELNRLATMSSPADASGCYGLSWTYDAWGNRLSQNTTSGSCGSPSHGVLANNRLTDTGFGHDSSGNMTADNIHAYTYNGESELIQVDGGSTATYVYDALGQRVRKTTGGVAKDYVYDTGGGVVAEIQGSTWTNGYAFAGGELIAEYNGTIGSTGATTLFSHKDHLGSTRAVSTAVGGISDSMDYLPYGELLSGGNSTSHKFTGKERDSESGLDEFGARYLSSALGRFVSADWSAKPTSVPYADFANPQTLNLYAYVNNNPLSKADPDGHEVDFGVGKKEAQKLLLQNLSKEEQKMFTVEKNKTSGKFELQFKSGAAAKFAQTGQTHTSAWVKLQDAITSDKVMTVNVAKTYADSSGRSVNISQADGGGVTLMHPNGNSEVYVSPKGNPYTLKGTEGQTISDPKNIIMGHELLGHALENAMGGNTGQHRAIEVENILRQEQNLALRSNPEQPHE